MHGGKNVQETPLRERTRRGCSELAMRAEPSSLCLAYLTMIDADARSKIDG